VADTSTGLKENAAGVLCYLLGWITGILFLILEPKNNFIRFHAFQSILVFGIIMVVSLVFSPVPILGAIIQWIAGVIGFILWILLMVMAAQEKKYKLPWTGNLAEKWAG
jgi:uncharacterized membrane protein